MLFTRWLNSLAGRIFSTRKRTSRRQRIPARPAHVARAATWFAGSGPSGGFSDVTEELENRCLLTYTASLAANVVTFTGDATGDILTLTTGPGGVLQHNRFSAGDAGFVSDLDLDSATAGVQSQTVVSLTGLIVNAGDGNDTVQFGALALNAITAANNLAIDGGTGAADAIDVQGAVSVGSVGAGGISFTAEAITQSASLTVTGATVLNAPANNISLTQANNFIGTVNVTGQDVTINDINLIDFFAVSAANLTVTAAGVITDNAGGTTVVVTGTTSLTAGAGNSITLDNANNNFGGAVSIVTGNNVTLTDILGIDLGASTISGGLTVNLSAGGSVTDSGNLTVGGTTQINAAGLNVVLNSAGNNFTGAGGVGVNGNDVTLVDSNALILATSNVTGFLSATATAGDITSAVAGALNVTGTATFTANGIGANITVNNAANNFASTVAFNGAGGLGSVNVLDTTPLALPALNLSGNLTVNAAGITQTGTLIVNGTTSLAAGVGNDITLTTGTNNFIGAVTVVSGRAVQITDTNTITFGSVTTSSNIGNFTVIANGAITDGGVGVITVGGNTSLTAGAGNNITLNRAANDFGSVANGPVTIVSGNNVTLRDANTIDLGTATVSGNLSVTSGGAITQTAGTLTVTGTTTLNSGAAAITLNNANDFQGAVTIAAAGIVQLNDINAIDLGGATVTGLTVTATGNITDSGNLAVNGGGSLTLTANGATSDVTLDSAGNAFTGTIVVTVARNVTLVNTAGTILGASTINGNLSVTESSFAGIIQLGALSITGTTSLNSTSPSTINLGTQANNFGGDVTIVAGQNVTLNDTGAISFGGASTISGNLVVTANGLISDGAAGTLAVTGTISLTAGAANSITLDNVANNFTGAVTVVSGNAVAISDINGITFGTVTTSGAGTGNFTVVAGGNVALGSTGIITVANNLAVTTVGTITQTNQVLVTGTTALSSGVANSITLNNAANNFVGLVSVTSANGVSIADVNAISFGPVTTSSGGNFTISADSNIDFQGLTTVTGNLSATSNALGGGGTITDTGAGQLLVTGTTALTAGNANNIILDNAANNYTGAVSVVSGNNVTLLDANAITLGAVAATNNLIVTVAAGNITATAGALVVGNNTTFNAVAGSNIIASNAANSFTGTVTLTPAAGLGNVSIVDTTSLDLQALNITGNLVAQGAGLTQSGAVVVGGTSVLTSTGAANAINLNNANNDFVGAVTVVSGQNATIRDTLNTSGIDFGGVSNVTGNLTVVTNGPITDSGNLVVTGATSLTAGAGNNITLDSTTNNFIGSVAVVSALNVALTDVNAISLGTSNISGTLAVTALAGAITDGGNVVVAGTTTLTASGAGNDITLDNAGTDFGGTVTVVSGRNVTLVDNALSIDLGAMAVSGLLSVTSTAGNITNSGALVVNGNSTFTANTAAANITVNNPGNTFVGTVTFAGAGGLNNVSVSDTTPLDLGALNIAGNLAATSLAVGVLSITDSGNLIVGGTTTLTADPTSNITLNNNNQFGGAVSVVTGNNVILNETSANGIVLGTSTISGTLNVTSLSHITETGALTVTGAPTFTVTGVNSDVLLTAANFFTVTPIITNNVNVRDVTIRDTNPLAAIPVIATTAGNTIRDLSIIFNNRAIVLPALVFARDLNVQAGGDITQSAALTVPRAATFTVPNANNITLTNPANNFSTVAGFGVNVVSGNNVSLTDANAINIGNLFPVGNVTINSTGTVDFVGTGASNIGGTLNVNNGAAAGADINQTGALGGGTLRVVGTTTLAAGNAVGNDINLSGNVLPNDFVTVVITSANNVVLDDVDGIVLGTSTVTGTLGVNFAVNGIGGSVSQSGVLTVTGVATFTSFDFFAGTSDVLLDTQANNFAATPVFVEFLPGPGSGIRDLKLRNTNAGAAVPDTSGIISAGALRDLTLIFDSNGIAIPAATAITITRNLVLTAGGAITDAASGPTTVGGTTTLTTTNVGGSLISLTNAANNFTGAVSATNTGANAITLSSVANPMLLGTINTANNLTVTALGITQTNATALDGATVVGTSTFNGGAGVITLNDPQNNFTGAVSLNNNGANNVVVTDINAIVLGASVVGTGTLTVNAIGITQAAPANAIVQAGGAGAATFNAGAGVITLNDPNNDFTGNVSLNNTGANNVSITDVNAIQFGTSNVGTGTLTVNAVGITQAAATSIIQTAAAGAATFNGGAAVITLNNANNDFTGAVSVNNNAANNILLNDTNSLILGASAFGGTLGVTAGGTITQTGALVGNGVATFTVTAALSDILLGTNNNNLAAIPVFTANGNIRDLALRNINGAAAVPVIPAGLRNLTLDFPNVAIPLPNLNITGNLSVTAGGLIDDNGAASVLLIGGSTTLNAGPANNVSFTNVASNFNTVSTTAANNVTLVDLNNIDLGASNIAGLFTVTAGNTAASHITESGILLVGTGGSVFTLQGANTDVLLGGFANNIVYPITIATLGAGLLRNFTLQNVNAGPAVINFPAAANNLTLIIQGAFSSGALNLAGNLNLTTTGSITQTGAWVVAGTSTFAPGALNDVTLNNAANNFNIVSISDGIAGTTPDARNVAITDINNIDFGTSDIGGTLNVVVTAAGPIVAITDSGNIKVLGLTTLTPGAANSILLNSAGNDFASLAITNGTNAAVVDTNSIILDNIALAGNLGVAVTGNITQNGGTAVVANAGTTTLSAGAAGNITLNNAGNDFGTVSISDGNALTAPDANNVSLNDLSAIDLGGSNIGGTLNVTSNGAITNSANVVVVGTTTLSAGAANNVTMNSVGNDFQGAVSVLTGNAVTLTDTNGIVLGQVTPNNVASTLTVNAGGAITDTVGSIINVPTLATFNAGANPITLGNDAGDATNFGSLAATGTVVSISEDSSVNLNLINATNLNLTSETGAIIDNNNNVGLNSNNINATNVALRALNGIGSGNALETTIGTLSFLNTTAGNVEIANTGALTVNNFGGLATSNNTAAGGKTTLSATSPVTFAVNTITVGDLTAQAIESGTTNFDNVTVNVGVTVQSMTGDVIFQAGDDIVVNVGALVLATSVNGDVFFDSGFGDTDTEGSMTLSGRINANTNSGVVDLNANGTQGVAQTAGLIIGNALRLRSTNESSGSFTLTSATNDLNIIAASTAAGISYRDANALVVQNVTAQAVLTTGITTTGDNVTLQAGNTLFIDDKIALGAGNLSVTAGGNVTQNVNDTIVAAGLELVGNVDVILNETANDITFLAANTKSINYDDANGLTVGIVGGTTGVTTVNDFIVDAGGTIQINANSVIGGNMDLEADANNAPAIGAISGTGSIVVTGTTALKTAVPATAANDITFANAANNFIGDVTITAANDATLVDVNSLNFAAAAITANLNVTTGGAVGNNLTDSGTVTVGGTSIFAAGLGNVVLDSPTNNFINSVTVTNAANATFVDTNAIDFGNVTTSAAFNVTAGGPVSDSGVLLITGTATISNVGNTVILDSLNNFVGAVSVNGTNVTLNDITAIDLGTINATGNLAVTSGGAMTDSGTIKVTGTTTLNSTAVASILLDSQTNDFTGAVTITNALNASIDDATGITFGAVTTAGNFAIDAGGNVVLGGATNVGGTLIIDANANLPGVGGSITDNAGAGVIKVGGTTSFNTGNPLNAANDISLTNAANNFNLAVTILSANDATLDDLNGITFAAVTTNANFTVNASGDVALGGATTVGGNLDIETDAHNAAGGSITGGGVITVTGTSLLDATPTGTATNDVTLTNAANNFIGVVTILANDAAIGDANTVTFGAVTTVGDFTVTAGGNVSLTGLTGVGQNMSINTTSNNVLGGTITDAAAAVTVGGTTSLTAGAANNITLINAGDDFGGSVTVVSGNNVTLNDITNIDFAAATVSGTLGVTANGSITDTGVLVVTGIATFAPSAGNNTILDSANNFSTVVITNGANATLTDTGAIILGNVTLTANLIVNAGGAVTDSGTLLIGGTTTINNAGNVVTLDTANNNFTGAVSVTGTNVTLVDVNAIDLGNITATGTLSVTAGGAVSDSGILLITGTTTVNNVGNTVILDSANNFTGAVSASGTNITLNDINAIDLNVITATGNLQVTSAGAMTDTAVTGVITVGGTTLLNSGVAASILLDSVTNNFTGVVTITNALNASIDDANGIAFGNVMTAGNFTVDAGGNVVLGGATNVVGNLAVDANINLPGVGGSITDNVGVGVLMITGTTTLNTGNPANGANDISLTNAANNFIGAVTITSANDASIDDANVITFGAVTTNANFTVDAGGLVTLSGATNIGTNLDIETDANNAAGGGILGTAAIVVAGNALFDATPNGTATNDVTLNAANDFQGPVTIIANDATVNDINAVNLGAQTINENLTMTAGGNVTFNGAANIGQNLSINTTTNNVAGGTITDNATVVVGGTTTLTAGAANDITLDDANNNFNTVNVVSGSNVTLNDINSIDFSGANVSGNLVVTAAGNITDTGNIAVTGNASFLTTGAGSIVLGDGAVNTNFGSLTLNSATTATVTEDSATILAGNNVLAGTLTLTSAGAVTDAVGTVIAVVGGAANISGTSINLTDNVADNFGVTAAAVFTASGGGAITINAAGTANFGAVTFNTTGNVTINEDSGTDLFNISTAANLILVSTGGITDQVGSSVTATGTASLSGTSITLLDDVSEILTVTGNTNFAASGGGAITLNAAGTGNFGSITFNTTGNVTINEDSATDIANVNTAAILTLVSTGAVTDQAGASVTMTGAANITGTSITLADNAADVLNVAANANLTATSGGAITINAAGTVNFGSLTVNATGNVTVTEDSATNFNGNSTAAILTVTSAGAIVDNAAATLVVAGLATFADGAGAGITLNNAASNTYGTLTFNSTGAVTIVENNGTNLAGASTAGSLALTSAGAIVDDVGATLVVTGLATFADGAGAGITLNNAASNTYGTLTFTSTGAVTIVENNGTNLAGASTANTLNLTSAGAIVDDVGATLVVTGLATFADGAGAGITLNNAASNTYGTLRFNSTSAVTIVENDGTDLSGTSTAGTLALVSAGAITDGVGSGASLTTTGTASFSGTSVSLADNGSDVLSIGGNASFTASGGGVITIAAAGAANFLSLTFNTTGAVTITEDSATDLSGVSTANTLALVSAGLITDTVGGGASLTTTGAASFSGTSVSLSDNALDVLSIGGNASFTASGGGAITVATTGTANFLSLTFNTTGIVNITEDSAMDLSGSSTAATLTLLTAAGALTDAAAASTIVTGAANLTGTSITLGDAGAIANFNTLTATSTTGSITIAETSGVTLTNVTAPSGNVTITSTGAIIASIVSAVGAGNDVSLTANAGDVTVGTVSATDDVTIIATLGSILDDINDATTDITGDLVTLTAANGVGTAGSSLDTAANFLDVSVTANGLINLAELNSVTLTDIDTFNGSITITAAGQMDVTDVQSLNDDDANDISLTTTAGGPMLVGLINALTLGDVTLISAGAVLEANNTGLTDITADVLSITANGAIGASGQDLDLSVNTLTTNSAAANGAQFVRELNSLTIGTTDLNAGVNTITIGGGTILTTNNGTVSLADDGDLLSNVIVQSGATLGGTGTTLVVTVQTGGNVAPGASPGILNTGSVTFAVGSNFTVEVNGATPGAVVSGHDQLNVTGTVILGGANLVTSGTIASNPGQTIVLINNDGVDAVVGQFAGLADGATVMINGVNFILTYAGGVGGNDVTLTQVGASLVLQDNDNAADVFTIRRVGVNTQLLNGVTIVNSIPTVAVTNITVAGENGQSDTLIIDFTGGDPLFQGPSAPATVTFNGGSGAGIDRVQLLGNGTTTTANYTPDPAPAPGTANAGKVEFNSLAVLTFTGLEPLDITGMLGVTLTGSSGVDVLTVAQGTDFTAGGVNQALRVTGTVNGGAPMESLAVWGSTTFVINAGDGNDSLTITNGANAHGINTITFNGGNNDDTFNINGAITAAGVVTLNGDANNDTFQFGNAGSVGGPINGGTGNDKLIGDNDGNAFNMTGADNGTLTGKTTGYNSFESLQGGSGTDSFAFAIGATVTGTIAGGAGTSDVLDYSAFLTAVSVNLATGAATNVFGGAAAGVSGIENIVGGAGADTLVGDANANSISGNAGDDTITGAAGNDTLDGGEVGETNGDRLIENVAGTSVLTNISLTGNGTDVLSGFEDASLTGSLGADSINASAFSGPVTLVGSDGNDTLTGSNFLALSDFIFGGNGDDVITGGAGDDFLSGGANNDRYIFSGTFGTDLVFDASGIDTLDLVAITSTVAVKLDASSDGAVTDANDGLITNGPNTVFFTPTQIDSIASGSGIDTITGSNEAGIWTPGANTNSNSVYTDGLLVTVTFTGFETLQGEANDDRFEINVNTNLTLRGGDGDDRFVFGDGRTATAIFGEAGVDDTLDYTAYTTGIVVHLPSQATGITSLSGVEDVIGGSGNDSIIGDGLSNSLVGGAGDDTLTGGDGDDTLDGGADNDLLVETVIGDVVLTDALLTQDYDFDATVNETDVLADIERASLTGSGAADQINALAFTLGSTTLNGAAGNDTLIGSDQADSLSGGAGDDSLTGNGGNDNLNGGTNDDIYVFSGVFGNDTVVDSSGSDTLDFATVVDNLFANLQTGTITDLINTVNFTPSQIDSITGGLGSDTLQGQNATSNWNLDTPDSDYTGNTAQVDFSAFEVLQGGSGVDTFNVNNNVTFDLLGGDSGDIFNINDGFALTGDILAEGGPDVIKFFGTGLVDGSVDGGTSATLDYSAATGPIVITISDVGSIDGYQGTATNINVAFDNITTVIGSAASDTLRGDDSDSTWSLGATQTYKVNASAEILTFSNFETLQGQLDADSFNVTAPTAATLNGGLGNDIFTINNVLTGVANGEGGIDTLKGTRIDNVTLTGAGAIDGFNGNEPDVTGGFQNINVIVGNGGTFTGLDVDSTWTVNGLVATYDNGTDTIDVSGFQTLQGGTAKDTFLVIANSKFNLLGGDGADSFDIDFTLMGVVQGGLGDDTLMGNKIDDVFLIGSDATNGFSGLESDITTGGFTGINFLQGNGISARLVGQSLNSTWLLDGSPTYFNGTDTLPFDGFNTLQGGSAVDKFLVTLNSVAVLRGGAGNDQFLITAGLIGSADGEAGNDTLNGAGATSTLTLLGGTGDDSITGGALSDFLDGGDGTDRIFGGAGNDRLRGGLGNDLLDGQGDTDCVDEILAVGASGFVLQNTLLTGMGTDTLVSIECAELTGNSGNNLLDASKSTLVPVTLHGGAGNDTLIGSGQNDVLDGGANFDLVKQTIKGNVTITGNTILAHIISPPSDDTLQSVEAVDITNIATVATTMDSSGYTGQVTLRGGAGNDTIRTGSGDSELRGNAGNDLLIAGSGQDLLFGGVGNDTLQGGIGNDTLRGEVGNDSLRGDSGDDQLFGDAGSDKLLGGIGQDLLDGGADNDTLLGEDGHDTMTGGGGDDVMSGGNGHDTMSGGAGNDRMIGGDGDDSMSGGDGNDVIMGQDGSDRIDGGGGTDTLVGGLGSGLKGLGNDTIIGANSEINELFAFNFDKLLI